MSRLTSVRVVVATLACAGALWLLQGRAPRAMAVNRVVDGRPFTVEESGHGPDIVIFADGKPISALASSVAGRHRVIVAPPSILEGPQPSALPTVLQALGVTGDSTIVAAVPAMAHLLDGMKNPSGNLRLATLDVDADAVDANEARSVFRQSSSPMFLLSRPSGPAWNHYRAAGPGGSVSVSLIDACSEGLMGSCDAQLSSFLEGFAESPSSLVTGARLQDQMRSAGPAPPVIVIPNGQLRSSWTSDGSDERDAFVSTSAILSKRIAVAATETTVSEYRRFVEATGYRPGEGCWYHTLDKEWVLYERANWAAPPFTQTDEHPVACVSYEDASEYAAWLSDQTGHRYRLPTEVEFEFSNRAGRPGPYGFEIDQAIELCAKANGADLASRFDYANKCDDGFAATAPVASFPPNDFGLYDTSGNLWELTSDCWRSDYVRAMFNLVGLSQRDGSASETRTCSGRHIIRGGAFISSPMNLRVMRREQEGARSTRNGFRVVRELP